MTFYWGFKIVDGRTKLQILQISQGLISESLCYIKLEVGTDGHVKVFAKSGERATDADSNELKDNAVDSYRVENYTNTGQ